MAELRLDQNQEVKQGFAGDAFNTAVYAHRQLGPQRVGFYSHIGNDPLSSAFLDFMADEGLNPDDLPRAEDRNIGIYSVSTDPTGERSFHYWRNQSAARQMFADQAEFHALPSAKIVYVSGITMAILSPAARLNLMAWLRSIRGTSVLAYDSNYRPKLWEDKATAQAINRQMWALADIALPSIDDEMDLFDETKDAQTIQRFSDGDFTVSVVKRGKLGPVVPGHQAPLPDFLPAVDVMDTTAAGDSFNGGFLAAWVQGDTLNNCLHAGHDLACEVVQKPGAIIDRA